MLLGPYSTGVAVGAEGVATNNATTSTQVEGYINSVYLKYTIDYDALADVIVNGTFAADSDWTKGANWTIPIAHKATAAAAVADLTATVAPLTNGHVYYVTYTLVVTGGSVTFTDGVNSGTTRSTSGTYSEIFTAGAAAFAFHPIAAFSGTIDDVTAYELTSHYGTKFVLATAGTNIPVYTLLTVDNSITDGMLRPRVVPDNLLGVDLIALALAERWPVCDYLNVKIDESVAGDSVDVWLLVERA